jgi:S-adenosylmethionine-diacylglycerol 3-amino-3-carboxypropyl transferase
MAELRSPVTDSVLAKGISYAQCWEDPRMLTEALAVGPDDDVLSICSAGDNSFALAIAGARSVTAVDLSLPQLALAEAKRVAARELPVQSVRSFLGLGHFGRRVWFYHYLRPHLSDEARAWWDQHEDVVRAGIMGAGRFERYLGTFRERVLPLVHGRDVIDGMLACDSLDAQRAFFEARWDTWRWRSLVRAFFSRPVMARLGRSREQFAQVEGGVGDRFLARAKHVLTEVPVADNYFVRWILTGEHGDLERAHPWITTPGHAALKASADRVRFVHASLEDFLLRCDPGSFSAFNYSNLFEYVSAEHAARLLELTVRAARPGARIAYWNLLVDRSRPPHLADRIEVRADLAARLAATDRAFFYKAFRVEVVRG